MPKLEGLVGRPQRHVSVVNVENPCGPLLATPSFEGRDNYCPSASGQISKEEWLKKCREEVGITSDPGVSRTTRWRRKKARTKDEDWKEHTCKTCGKAMLGHGQFYGKRYCPNTPGQIPYSDWLSEQRGKRSVKKKKTRTPTRKDPRPQTTKARKVYTCTLCKKLMRGSGHTHFKGIRYCPNVPSQVSLEEWLTQRHIELETFNS